MKPPENLYIVEATLIAGITRSTPSCKPIDSSDDALGRFKVKTWDRQCAATLVSIEVIHADDEQGYVVYEPGSRAFATTFRYDESNQLVEQES